MTAKEYMKQKAKELKSMAEEIWDKEEELLKECPETYDEWADICARLDELADEIDVEFGG